MTLDLLCVQRNLSTLWTVESARTALVSGRQTDGIASDIASTVDKKGVRLYASLINIGRQDLMDSIYPGCARVLARNWTGLVRQFMETCPPRHYNLNNAARGFADFLREHCPEHVARHPFLIELAEYEWLELEVMECADIHAAAEKIVLDSPEKFQNYQPVLNPVLILRHYQYPVTKIVDWLENDIKLPRRVKKEPTYLAIYRDPVELHARFLELGAASFALLERMASDNVTYAELLMIANALNPDANPQETVVGTLELFENLQDLNVLIGSRQANL